MAKKDLKNEIRHEDEIVLEKPKKKRKTAREKRAIAMKIAGWVMAISMIVGSIISIFGLLMYK